MAQAVHGHGGLWIAPAASGFDAREIGGTTTVSRDDGATLLRECAGALHSSPDAIGLISWNEFSENSHIEPSVDHGTRYLDAARRCSTAARADHVAAGSFAGDTADSSSPGKGLATGLIVAPLTLFGLAVAVVTVVRRSRHHRTDDPNGTPGNGPPPRPERRDHGGRPVHSHAHRRP
jgi:hypothetical protein